MDYIIVFYWSIFDSHRYDMYLYYREVIGLELKYAVEKVVNELG